MYLNCCTYVWWSKHFVTWSIISLSRILWINTRSLSDTSCLKLLLSKNGKWKRQSVSMTLWFQNKYRIKISICVQDYFRESYKVFSNCLCHPQTFPGPLQAISTFLKYLQPIRQTSDMAESWIPQTWDMYQKLLSKR